MRRYLILWALIALTFACTNQKNTTTEINVNEYVNQHIGLKGGRTYLAAQLPFGMISPGPNYKGFRSKNISIDTITGFSHIHACGTGCGDKWGSIYLMPVKGEIKSLQQIDKIEGEISQPGYYSANLVNNNINTELTASTRTAIHKYTFTEKNQNILFDISRHLNNKYDTSFIEVTSPTQLQGYLSEGAFCSATKELHKVYFYLKINTPAKSYGCFNNAEKKEESKTLGTDIGAWFSYDLPENTSIEARLAISFVSIANAKENLEAETKEKSFEDIKNIAAGDWNNMLSRIQVEGKSEDDKTQFYSGLYRMLLHPNVYNDVNGEYLSFAHYPAKGERHVKKAEDYTRYTLFSMWDTYRNLHPFFCLVYPEYQTDMAKSMLGMYEDKGWLPKWEHHGVETYNMNGAPAGIILCDTYLRGIHNFDVNLAYEAILKESTFADSASKERNRPGQEHYNKFGGWIPQDYVMIKPPVWGPVSTTLEYNLADWNFAQFCQALGKTEVAETFLQKSVGYRNFYNPDLGLLAPKRANGEWYQPFDPNKFTMFCVDCPYVEGNAWNYSFAAPHDINGLIELYGDEMSFVNQLQKCFDDHQFHIGNEPDINYPFLFNFVEGEEWRTQETVREIMRSKFNSSISGIPGEEDAGTLSAWLVYSMMGFYPYCPGDMNYQISSPVFDKVSIRLNTDYYPGKNFEIISKNNSVENIYIQAIELNGDKQEKYTINHNDMVKGGQLKIVLKGMK